MHKKWPSTYFSVSESQFLSRPDSNQGKSVPCPQASLSGLLWLLGIRADIPFTSSTHGPSWANNYPHSGMGKGGQGPVHALQARLPRWDPGKVRSAPTAGFLGLWQGCFPKHKPELLPSATMPYSPERFYAKPSSFCPQVCGN